MRNFSRRLRRLSFRGAPIDVDRWMWNAGAIGVDPSAFGVVDDWIAFIDEVWPRYRRGLVEQYSIGMLLQQRGELSACDDRILHYWYQTDEYTAAVQRELEVLRGLPDDQALVRVREEPGARHLPRAGAAPDAAPEAHAPVAVRGALIPRVAGEAPTCRPAMLRTGA